MPLISFAEAKHRLLAKASPVLETETLNLADACGRALAVDLTAPITLPPFANAAMDGYALRMADMAHEGVRLPITQRIAAGSAPAPLAVGSAARIFTGAPLPEGADTVVMQEWCEADGDTVTIQRMPRGGDHVRQPGSAMRAGEVMVAAGEQLTAAALGLAASVGFAQVSAYRRLRVAIFSTGSELVEPGQPLGPGQIYNANRVLMSAFLSDLGCQVIDLGIVADERAATQATLRRAASEADLVLTSGGMSVGEEDHVVAAVRAEGQLDVWKIAAKPGKPLAFGTVSDTPFIGLPGNPVAVCVGLSTLVAPYLRRCQGYSRIEPEPLSLRADFGYAVKGDRMELVRVRRNGQGGLDVHPNQDSAVIASAAWADGLVPVEPGTHIAPGDMVHFWPAPHQRP